MYDASDPTTHNVCVTDALKEVASPYEKGQIALAGLVSTILKPSNDKKKLWEHIQGQIQMCSRLDKHSFGMYGFMVTQQTGHEEETHTETQLRIKRTLF